MATWRGLSFGLSGCLLLLAAMLPLQPGKTSADEEWVIRSFDATYSIGEDGRVRVTEAVIVDFGELQRHGIYRDIPVEYPFDADSVRSIALSGITVDDGSQPLPFEVSTEGANKRLKIGDPESSPAVGRRIGSLTP